MKTTMQWCTENKYLVFSLIFALLAGFPLLHQGLIPTHDGEYHLIRFYEFDKILRSGIWYPRWAPDLNYGYGVPLFTYVYPLPNYIASIFHFLGISFLDSVKLNMFAATLVGGCFSYLFAKRFWGKLGGFVSSITYTFAPYHFVDIYVRGSVGEVWSLALFPAFLWAYTTYTETKSKWLIALSSIFLALIIFSHNILGLMFFAFVVSYMAFTLALSRDKKKLFTHSCLILLTSLGLSSIFWIPALVEKQYVSGLQIYNIMQNFPDLSQLLFPSWGTDFFGAASGNTMSVQIGVANIFVIFFSTYFLLKNLRNKKKNIAYIGFSLVWVSALIFLMLQNSLFIWKYVPLVNYFQFPWRFLSLLILVCAFLAGSISQIKHGKLFSWIFVFFVLITTLGYTQPAYYMLRNDIYYTSRSNFIDGTNSPGNAFNTIWNPSHTSRPLGLFIAHDTLVESIKRNSPTNFEATIEATKNTNQIVAISYFPGWTTYVDNRPTPVVPAHGLISFLLPKGKHRVHIVLQSTNIELLASWISSITMLFLLFFLLRKKGM